MMPLALLALLSMPMGEPATADEAVIRCEPADPCCHVTQFISWNPWDYVKYCTPPVIEDDPL